MPIGLGTDEPRLSLAVHLTVREIDVISRCMHAVLHGPWLWPGQMQAMYDVDPAEFSGVVATWPHGEGSRVQTLAVDGALLAVGKGIRFTPPEWNAWIGFPKGEVVRVFERVRQLRSEGVVADWPEERPA